jgi:hypothetical protein
LSGDLSDRRHIMQMSRRGDRACNLAAGENNAARIYCDQAGKQAIFEIM